MITPLLLGVAGGLFFVAAAWLSPRTPGPAAPVLLRLAFDGVATLCVVLALVCAAR